MGKGYLDPVHSDRPVQIRLRIFKVRQQRDAAARQIQIQHMGHAGDAATDADAIYAGEASNWISTYQHSSDSSSRCSIRWNL